MRDTWRFFFFAFLVRAVRRFVLFSLVVLPHRKAVDPVPVFAALLLILRVACGTMFSLVRFLPPWNVLTLYGEYGM